MKCLSIKNPWAWMIINGKKTMEIRTWKTDYRGRILIHAGLKYDSNFFTFDHGFPTDFEYGSIIGCADLVHVKELDFIQYANSSEQHQIPIYVKNYKFPGNLTPPKKCYGWILKDVIKYDDPIPYKGQLGLFNAKLTTIGR